MNHESSSWGNFIQQFGSRAMTLSSKGTLIVAFDAVNFGSKDSKILEYDLNGNLINTIYSQSDDIDYIMEISGIDINEHGDVYFSVSKDPSQSGTVWEDSQVKKDRVMYLKNSPTIDIQPGDLSSTIEIKAIIDSGYNEWVETIILKPTDPQNALLTVSDSLKINIDSNNPPTANAQSVIAIEQGWCMPDVYF